MSDDELAKAQAEIQELERALHVEITVGARMVDENEDLRERYNKLKAAAREYKRLFESEDADAYDARCALWALIKEPP